MLKKKFLKKDDMYICIYTRDYYSAIKNNEIMLFRDYHTKQNRLDSLIPYDIKYMCSLSYVRNKCIYKTKTESQIWRIDLWLVMGKGWIWS